MSNEIVPSSPLSPNNLICVDVGSIPLNTRPAQQIEPSIWFKYEKEPGPDSHRFRVFDGSGYILCNVDEENIAKFIVNAANVYVLASIQN